MGLQSSNDAPYNNAAADRIEALRALLASHRLAGQTESDVQGNIADLLAARGVKFEREFVLKSARDRIDFVIGNVGVEVKIRGDRTSLLRQIGRYCESDQVAGLIVASTSIRLLVDLPPLVHGKPVKGVALRGGGMA